MMLKDYQIRQQLETLVSTFIRAEIDYDIWKEVCLDEEGQEIVPFPYEGFVDSIMDLFQENMCKC